MLFYLLISIVCHCCNTFPPLVRCRLWASRLRGWWAPNNQILLRNINQYQNLLQCRYHYHHNLHRQRHQFALIIVRQTMNSCVLTAGRYSVPSTTSHDTYPFIPESDHSFARWAAPYHDFLFLLYETINQKNMYWFFLITLFWKVISYHWRGHFCLLFQR